jgi:hypothetical protein
MATWTVEQKHEVWYQTTVEAETLEDAIKAADESDDWNIQTMTAEFCDEYWVMNEDSTEQYTISNGITYAE